MKTNVSVTMTCCRYLVYTFLSSAFLVHTASAVDFNWNVAGPADWNVGTNWDPEGPPAGGLGNNAFVNNGGTAELSADMPGIQDPNVGSGADSSGTLNQTAGTIANPEGGGSWMFVGRDGGVGVYNFSGGAVTKDRLYIGLGGGADGTLNMSGDAAVDNQFFIVGDGGTGTASISENATVHTTNEIWIGNAGGNGTLNQDAATVESDTWIAIGRDSATGVVNLSGSAVMRKLVQDDGDPEAVSDSEGSFIVIGGLGSGGTGTLNVKDDATVWSDTGLLLNETEGQTGIVNQSGGTVTLHDYAPKDFQPDYGSSIELDPNGWGLGEYHLSGGSLNAETIDVGGGLFDMTGGALSATNFVGDFTQQGGTTSPGSSPGTMTVTGNYSLDSGDLFMELDGLVAGTEYDQLIVTGDVSLAGDLTLDVGFSPSIGDMFTIIDNQGSNAVGGAFTQGSSILAGGFNFSISYTGGDGNDVVLTVEIPEPATLLLAGFALAGMAVRRRR